MMIEALLTHTFDREGVEGALKEHVVAARRDDVSPRALDRALHRTVFHYFDARGNEVEVARVVATLQL